MMNRSPQWRKGQCLVYARCSKAAQDASLGDQYRQIEAFRAEADLRPAQDPFEDDGERGHNEDRPGIQAVLEYVRTHPNPAKFNEDFIPILVYNVSRFGRFDDEKKIFYYLVEIERYGYEFYSVQDGLRSRGNIADFIQLIIRSQQAYQYTLDLSEYGIRTGCSLSEKGWWSGGSSPYGMDRITYGTDGKPRYRYVTLHDKTVEKRTLDGTLIESFPPINDKGKLRSAYSDKLKSDKVKLAPSLDRAKVVESIFRWFVVEGWGFKKIAAKLNQLGVAPPRGRKWLKGSVRDILRNPAYKGALVYGRRSDGKHHDVAFVKSAQGYAPRMRRRDVAKREFVHRPLEDCVVVENCHEAIVSPEVWEGALKRFAERRRGHLGIRGKGARGSAYLLTGDGLMTCVRCGYHFHGSTDRKSKIRYYLDGGYHMGGRDVCEMTLVRAEDLERIILQAIQAVAVDGDARLFDDEAELALAIERELAAQSPATERPDPEREALQDKLSAIRRKREEAERFEKEFGASASDLVRRIQAEEESLARDLAARRSETPEPMDGRERARLAREMARHRMFVHAVLEQGTPEERKRLVRVFVAAIEVDGQERKIRIGMYGGNSSLRVVPPTGFEPVFQP